MTSKEQVYENLRSNGLEPELVQALVDLAISEDLMGGTDVTSLATIPEIQISELDLVDSFTWCNCRNQYCSFSLFVSCK
jgi:hypothetical protein